MCHSNLPRQIHQYVLSKIYYDTAQKMKFSIKNFFSKSDQIRNFLRIWLHLLKKSLMENFIFLCSLDKGLFMIFVITLLCVLTSL